MWLVYFGCQYSQLNKLVSRYGKYPRILSCGSWDVGLGHFFSRNCGWNSAEMSAFLIGNCRSPHRATWTRGVWIWRGIAPIITSVARIPRDLLTVHFTSLCPDCVYSIITGYRSWVSKQTAGLWCYFPSQELVWLPPSNMADGLFFASNAQSVAEASEITSAKASGITPLSHIALQGTSHLIPANRVTSVRTSLKLTISILHRN